MFIRLQQRYSNIAGYSRFDRNLHGLNRVLNADLALPGYPNYTPELMRIA